jgi:hypothetical protein
MNESIVVNQTINQIEVIENTSTLELSTPGPQGPKGTQGVQGFGYAQLQGTQGVQGLQGPQGTQGTQGVQGVQGTQGTQGTQGVQGLLGTQGTQGVQGVQGAQGVQGTLGLQGSEGSFGGATFDYTFSTDTLNSDPGTGKIAFNANPTTATAMHIDASDDGATNISTFLNTIDDSSSTIKGHFRISQKLNSNIFKLYTITSITDNTGWFTVNCSYVSGNGNLSNLDDVLITFARTGDKGDTGVQGIQGLQGIQGTQGIQGNQGTQGVQGNQGTTGTQGTQGVQGIQGNQGLQGTQGNQGLQGVLGIQGTQGTQGVLGDKGIVAQISAPTNTDVLWLDTDEPAVTPANISVTYPVVNTGTTENAVISVLSGSTSNAGVLQLEDSFASPSTTTAATPNAVKAAYNLGNALVAPFMSGYYYRGVGFTAAVNATATVNTTYYTPFFVPVTTTFDRIVIRTGNGYSGTAIVRLGIYNSNAGKPSTVLLDAGTVSATSVNGTFSITISQQLTPGFYWLAANSQTAATTNTYVGISFSQAISYVGQPQNASTGTITYFTQSSVTGAFATATSLVDGVFAAGIAAYLRAV